jgi:glycosyltransferase involved in cell wall biosynthesis
MAGGMRILYLSALFPPDVLGGAEMSAHSQALWLRDQGHEVAVLTTAQRPTDEVHGESVDGLRMYRLHLPRLYPVYRFAAAKAWQKPLWHLQDHLDPNNRCIASRVLDEFRPDVATLHVVQGLGYNVLSELAKRDIPVVYFLHDLGLACVKMSMFRNGHECEKQCTICSLSSWYKESLIRKLRRVGFCSPSRANLSRVAEFLPIQRYPHTAILNPNRYPPATVPRTESAELRVLYAGRIHQTKGVHILLQSARRLQRAGGNARPFHVTVVGTGPQEAELRSEYGAEPWCTFTGFVNQSELSNIMLNSDVLCVPSVWFENSPGVLIQALGLGLPVLGSNMGGIPELVEHGRNGLVLPPGDVEAWHGALVDLVQDGERLSGWRSYALAHADRFDQDYLGRLTLDFLETVINAGSAGSP